MLSRQAIELIAAVAASAAVLLGITRLDQDTNTALAGERLDATRGSILDRFGQRLAWTTAGPTAAPRYGFPGLSPLLGYRDPGGKWTGLEGRYDGFLTGQAAEHDWRTFLLHLRGGSVSGGNVRLTIDPNVQRAAEEALGSHWGAIVAIDPRTGAVRAMVSKPDCSASNLEKAIGIQRCLHDSRHPLLNRATQLLLAPGSTFKIVTLSAALDTGTFQLSTLFSGEDIFGPSPYFDNVTYPSNITRSDLTVLTLEQALAFSDNFTFAHIGLTLGSSTLLKYAHRYYIGRNTPFDVPVAVSHIANGNHHPSKAVLAQSSFGAEVDQVTPLQMALIAATVANHGVMMAPYVVQDLETTGGKVVESHQTHVLSRVMSRASAAKVRDGMVFVVNEGSGFEAQIPGMSVAGKTGTAASGGDKAHAWFISFAPADHPRIAVAVLREYSGEGFEYAAPLARKVMVAALKAFPAPRAGTSKRTSRSAN